MKNSKQEKQKKYIKTNTVKVIGKVLLIIPQQINLSAFINDIRYFLVEHYLNYLEILFSFSYRLPIKCGDWWVQGNNFNLYFLWSMCPTLPLRE